MGGLPEPIRVRHPSTDRTTVTKSILEKKKTADCDRDRGLDIVEHSLRDVFNDVSKYIRNISISLNTVFP